MDFDLETKTGAQAAFGLAARLVQQEPDAEWVDLCISEELFTGCPFAMEDSAVSTGLSSLSEWCEAARTNEREATESIQRDWLRLFAGVGSPEAPIWEAVYVEPNGTIIGQSTLEVRRIYRKWGLEFERKGNEPDNSLGLMLAFCAHLMGQEVEAIEASDGERAAAAAAGIEEIMVKHMLPWAAAWRFLVQSHAKTDYYRGIGELVFGLERAYARRFNVVYDEGKEAFVYSSSR